MRILTRLRRLATMRRFRRACFASAALILLLAAVAPTFAKAADRRSTYADGVIGSVNLVGPPLMASSSLSFRRKAAAILRGPVAAAAEAPTPADNTVLHIDAAVAHTKQVYDTDGALVVTATS